MCRHAFCSCPCVYVITEDQRCREGYPAPYFQQTLFGFVAYSRWIISTSSSSYTYSSFLPSFSFPLNFPHPPVASPTPDQRLTQEKQRQMFQEHTTALSPPTPLPFVLDQQLTPGKNWPYRRAHTYTQRTPLHKSARAQQLSNWMNNTHTHTHTYTKCCPNPFSVPDSSHPGVRPGHGVQGRGSLWAAGLANPAAGGHGFSN